MFSENFIPIYLFICFQKLSKAGNFAEGCAVPYKAYFSYFQIQKLVGKIKEFIKVHMK